MSVKIAEHNEIIEWASASRTMEGQSVSGDLQLVKTFPGGTLLAAIDGIGHGDEAAAAARAAAQILEMRAQEPPILLVRRCHELLTRTRGVVMTVAVMRGTENIMTWIGVGNVEGRLLRGDGDVPSSHPVETLLLRGGLIGSQLPPLQASVVTIARGDLLILATDGIEGKFDARISRKDSPGQIAGKILDQHGKRSDDALVLVARYLGSGV